jgi:hypothetical protein
MHIPSFGLQMQDSSRTGSDSLCLGPRCWTFEELRHTDSAFRVIDGGCQLPERPSTPCTHHQEVRVRFAVLGQRYNKRPYSATANEQFGTRRHWNHVCTTPMPTQQALMPMLTMGTRGMLSIGRGHAVSRPLRPRTDYERLTCRMVTGALLPCPPTSMR